MRSAMRAASQLPGMGPTDVDDTLHLHVNQKSDYDYDYDETKMIFTSNVLFLVAKTVKNHFFKESCKLKFGCHLL